MKMTAQQVADHQRHHGFANPIAPAQAVLPMIVTSPGRLDFFMDFIPPAGTSQQKGERIVIPKGWPADKSKKPFVHHFTKPEIEKAEKEIAAHLTIFRPAVPFTGPLRFVSEWTWPWRQSEPKKNRVDGWKWKDVQPDWENISKILCDQMQALGFFLNDGQIADGRAIKGWGDRPGIRITLEQLQRP